MVQDRGLGLDGHGRDFGDDRLHLVGLGVLVLALMGRHVVIGVVATAQGDADGLRVVQAQARLLGGPGRVGRAVDARDGAVVLGAVGREVPGQRLLRAGAHGRVVPATQRALRHGRREGAALGLTLLRAGPGRVVARRRRVPGLEALQEGAPAPAAVPDDAAAQNGQDEEQAADGDAHLGAQAEAALRVVGHASGDRIRVRDVDGRPGEWRALDGEESAGRGLLEAGRVENGQEVVQVVVVSGKQASGALGDLDLVPEGAVLVCRDILRERIILECSL